jgi:hypothetical protein
MRAATTFAARRLTCQQDSVARLELTDRLREDRGFVFEAVRLSSVNKTMIR